MRVSHVWARCRQGGEAGRNRPDLNFCFFLFKQKEKEEINGAKNAYPKHNIFLKPQRNKVNEKQNPYLKSKIDCHYFPYL